MYVYHDFTLNYQCRSSIVSHRFSGQHHKHLPRQKCESIRVQKGSFSILIFIIIVIQVGGLPLGYLMLGISAERSKSSLVPSTLDVHCALFASSSLWLLVSELSLLRVRLSGFSRLVRWYIGQDWCLATASLLGLFVGGFVLSALGIEREESSRKKLVNAFSAQS